MTVLSAAANRQSKRGTPRTRRALMANSTTIYKGAIVMANASGLATNGADTASFTTLGIAAETVISGTGGADYIQIEYDQEYLFAFTGTATQAMVGTAATCSDNDTLAVAATTTNDIVVGKISEFVSTTRVWCHVPGITN